MKLSSGELIREIAVRLLFHIDRADTLLSPEIIATIDLLGAVHGVFLALLLISRRRNTLSNRILSVAMIGFAVDLLSAAYVAKGYERALPHFMGVDFLLPFIYGPVIYLYTRTVSEGTKSLNGRMALHFLPFLAALLYMIPFYLQSPEEKLVLFESPLAHPWMPALQILNDAKMFYSLLYLLMVFIVLYRHRQRVRHAFSSLDRINLSWLQNLLIGGLLTWGVSFFFQYFWDTSAATNSNPLAGNVDYVSIAVACFVYAIGYLGLRQPEIFSSPILQAATIDDDRDASAPDGPRYERSGMDAATAEKLERRLTDAMEGDRLYRRSSLTLLELADALDATPHQISEVLNTQIEKTFHDFVNGYRVQEVKQRLADPAGRAFTLLAIGMDAGFNSKSSFNSVFKKHTGQTPSEYRKKAPKED